ncbi:MAG: DUF4129 domain-containing transglutaminase family protein [Phycisphaerales bacterium]|nr:DUF4129 domain-containing transglutaminase family protein [Phycisphaerales bacterium]
MSLLRLYPLLSFAIVLLAIVAQCISQRNPWLLVLAGGLAALSRTFSEGPRGVTLPRALSLVLTAIALMWSATVAAGDLSQPIPAIGQFVVWLTVIKLYETHSLENEAERLILSLLLMVLASLISIDLLFGFLLLLWVGLGLVTLMLFQLHCAAERMQRQRARALGLDQVGSPKPVAGPGLRRHYRNVSLVSVVVIFIVSAACFLLFPRSLTSSLSRASLSRMGSAQVALDEGVNLMGATRISLSGAQVLSVGLTDAQGESLHLDRPLRLRAGVLTAYRGDGIWGVDPLGVESMELQADRWRSLLTPPDDLELITQDFILDEAEEQLLSMSVPVAIKVETNVTMEFRGSSQTMRVARESDSPMKYTVQAVPEPPIYRSRFPGQRRPGSEMIHSYANSRVTELAYELLDRAGVSTTPPTDLDAQLEWNVRVAEVFERFLKYGEFQYTLDLTTVGVSPDTEGMDPVERFLLHEQFGHCEYFASALTALCHCMQIPSRLVTGYVTNRFEEISQRYVVVRSDAHAWVEILGSGPRWTVFDPTPPANVPGTREASLGPIDKIVWLWRWLEGQWRFNVLGFDTETQLYLKDAMLPGIGATLSNGVDSARSWLMSAKKRLGLGGWYVPVLVALGLCGVAIVVLSVRARRRRRRILAVTDLAHVSGSASRRLAARLGFYVDMLDLLRRAGLPKPRWQPPADFADSLRAEHPEAASAVSELARGYYECRYGGEVATPGTQQHMKAALARLSQAVGLHS